MSEICAQNYCPVISRFVLQMSQTDGDIIVTKINFLNSTGTNEI